MIVKGNYFEIVSRTLFICKKLCGKFLSHEQDLLYNMSVTRFDSYERLHDQVDQVDQSIKFI